MLGAPHTLVNSARQRHRLALALTVGAAWIARPATQGADWMLMVAVLMIATALHVIGDSDATATTPMPETPPLTRLGAAHYGMAGVGVGLLVLVALRSTPEIAPALDEMTLGIQHLVWLMGVGLITLGLGGIGRFDWRLTKHQRQLAGVGLIAVVVRVIGLGTWMRYMPDEWIFISPIAMLGADQALLERVGRYATAPYVFTYWQAITATLAGGGLFGFRLMTAITGALTVIAVGLMTRELFDQRDHGGGSPTMLISITAALVLSTLPAHVHFSRLGLYNVMDPLFGVLGAWLVARGLRLNSRASYAAAGAMLGLTQYFYEAGKLMFPPLIIGWVVAMAMICRGERVLAQWRGLMITAGVAVIIGVLPWYGSAVQGVLLNNRLVDSSWVASAPITVERITRHFTTHVGSRIQILTSRGDQRDLPYSNANTGIVPIGLLPFFLAGLIRSITQARRSGNLLMVMWFGLTMMGLIYLNYATTARYVILHPVIAVVSALGLHHAVQVIIERYAKAILRVILAMMVVGQMVSYFGWYLPTLIDARDEQVLREGGYDLEDVIFRIQDLPAGSRVIILAEAHAMLETEQLTESWIAYFNPQITLERIDLTPYNNDALIALLNDLPPAQPVVILYWEDDTDTQAAITAVFETSPPLYSSAQVDVPITLTMVYATRRD